MSTYNLTALEKKACKAIGETLEANNFGDNLWDENEVAGVTKEGWYDTDLCWTSDIKWNGSKKQLGGLLSSLEQKHVIAMRYAEDNGHMEIWGIGKAVKALVEDVSTKKPAKTLKRNNLHDLAMSNLYILLAANLGNGYHVDYPQKSTFITISNDNSSYTLDMMVNDETGDLLITQWHDHDLGKHVDLASDMVRKGWKHLKETIDSYMHI